MFEKVYSYVHFVITEIKNIFLQNLTDFFKFVWSNNTLTRGKLVYWVEGHTTGEFLKI